ncbi:MAG: hypothetical protein IPG45_27500 [Deltaproteobacteria bacterium]|jgi:hypothetical protein|nr:hypothetical protein [Deltaproteobacteria bacterium]
MPTSIELLRRVPEDRFHQIVLSSPKKFREEVFRRAGIKNKGGGAFSLTSNAKTEVRSQRLYAALQEETEVTPEIAAELIRNYLYTRRDLLAEALDYFQVPHDHGLTNDDLDFMADLAVDKAQRLEELLKRKHDPVDVELYLDFMNIKRT